MMMVFVEDGVIDHLNTLIPVLNGILIEDDEQKECKEKTKSILRLIGRYCPANAFESICLSIINMQITESEESAINGLTTYRCLLEGHLEALPPGEGLMNKIEVVHRTFNNLGNSEFLSSLTKYMLTPFSELFVHLFTVIESRASEKEREDIYNTYKREIVRISLTALSIPMFFLVTDNLPEMNYKLIKNTIDKSSKLRRDEEGKCYIDILDKMVSKWEWALIEEVRPENHSNVNRNSNDTLVICALVNYYMINQNARFFGESIFLFESIASDKETFTKLVINMNSYINFYVDWSNTRFKRISTRRTEVLTSNRCASRWSCACLLS